MHRPCTNETSTFPVVITDLPNEIIFDILLRLPQNSLVCLRCVSKDMLNIVNSPVFVTLHTQRLLTNFLPRSINISHIDIPRDVPQLIHIDTDGLQSVTCNGDALAQREHPILSEFPMPPLNHKLEFVFCDLFCYQYYQRREDGWSRLIISYDNPCFLVNPLRGEVLRLPTATNAQVPACPKIDFFDQLAMGLDKVTNDLKIVRVTGSTNHNMVAQVHVLGTSSWREIRSVPPCNLSSRKVSAYGDMHWLVYARNSTSTSNEYSGNIASFDFHKEEFYFTPPPPCLQETYRGVEPADQIQRHIDRFFCYYHLVNFRGSMAVVNTQDKKANSKIEIWVMKNYDKKEWTLDYKVDTTVYIFDSFYPFYSYGFGCGRLECCEWEHGIFIGYEGGNGIRPTVFVDLRSLSMTSVKFLQSSGRDARVLSCHGSLISLASYGDLVKAEPNT